MENSVKPSHKKVLLISYHFPPSTAVGGFRIAKFAKNLPLLGWHVFVVTIKDHYLREKDPERLQGLKKIKIIRTNLLPGINNLYLQLKNSWFRKKFQENIFEKNLIESTPAFDKENVEEGEKLNQRIKRYVISLLLALPDSNRNWIIPATFHAVREIKREKINCIITTSPPVSVNLIGLLVKIITGVKWVVDFRDPWLNEAGNKRLHPTCALSLKIERYLEKKYCRKLILFLQQLKNYEIDIGSNTTTCRKINLLPFTMDLMKMLFPVSRI